MELKHQAIGQDVLNQDLIVILAAYRSGVANLEGMREFVAGSIWDLSDSRSPLDRMLLGELNVLLSEFDRGDRSESDLMSRINFLLTLPNRDYMPSLSGFKNYVEIDQEETERTPIS